MFCFSSQHLLSQLGKDPSYSSGSTLLSSCIQLTQKVTPLKYQSEILWPVFRALSLQMGRTCRPNLFTYNTERFGWMDFCIIYQPLFFLYVWCPGVLLTICLLPFIKMSYFVVIINLLHIFLA